MKYRGNASICHKLYGIVSKLSLGLFNTIR